MLTKAQVISLLSKEVTPALGCTEPVCVALCAASASNLAEGIPYSIEINVCPSIYKNAKSVAIPSFPYTGLEYAAAIGALIANPVKGLELFSDITDSISQKAIELVAAGAVSVTIVPEEKEVFVHACVHGTHNGESIIRQSHANIVQTRRNGEIILEVPHLANNRDEMVDELTKMSIREIRLLVESLQFEDISFLLEGKEMNESLAEYGLSDPDSFGFARAMQSENDLVGSGLMHRMILRTVSCAESRMTGVPRSVMSSAGSGNHGITAIIPVCELAAHLQKDDLSLCRALAISHLINIYIKHFSGKLSPLCGCGISAATAASAAMVWLMGGSDKEMAGTISNMVGNLTGMICDGAKVGCALKLGSAVSAALSSAYWAMSGVSLPRGNGIVTATPEESIRNIGRISLEGMCCTDETILDIMQRN